MTELFGDVSLRRDGRVAQVKIHRGPDNFFDEGLIGSLVTAFEEIDGDDDLSVSVLSSEGRHFCAGANFAANIDAENPDGSGGLNVSALYDEAVRLFACRKPIVGAIQGAAIGGGLGLALVPDFRVVGPGTRFSANFVKLGIHPGFGLTHTLPRLIGLQKASWMFMTGRRIKGPEALDLGLADLLVEDGEIETEALALAVEIAGGAPLALDSIRATLRGDLAEAVRTQTAHEAAEQTWQFKTEDHAEGVRAVAERRVGDFKRR